MNARTGERRMWRRRVDEQGEGDAGEIRRERVLTSRRDIDGEIDGEIDSDIRSEIDCEIDAGIDSGVGCHGCRDRGVVILAPSPPRHPLLLRFGGSRAWRLRDTVGHISWRSTGSAGGQTGSY